MKYNNKISNFLNIAIYSSKRNFRFLSLIIVLKKFQSTTFSRFKKAFFYLLTNYVDLLIIKVTRLKNLQNIDITILKLLININNVNIKFIVII